MLKDRREFKSADEKLLTSWRAMNTATAKNACVYHNVSTSSEREQNRLSVGVVFLHCDLNIYATSHRSVAKHKASSLLHIDDLSSD